MDQPGYPICFSWIGEIAKALANHVNVAFILAIAVMLVGGGLFKLDVKVLHELLPEV
jgi:hypothetical protein